MSDLDEPMTRARSMTASLLAKAEARARRLAETERTLPVPTQRALVELALWLPANVAIQFPKDADEAHITAPVGHRITEAPFVRLLRVDHDGAHLAVALPLSAEALAQVAAFVRVDAVDAVGVSERQAVEAPEAVAKPKRGRKARAA